jgi:hypothetical protein
VVEDIPAEGRTKEFGVPFAKENLINVEFRQGLPQCYLK